MYLTVTINVLSPIHLSSGQADVNIDAQVVHEANGLPYFPAKRFKGLLYESALEVTEMWKRCGMQDDYDVELATLFNHGKQEDDRYLIFDDLHIFPEEDYFEISEQIKLLEKNFSSFITTNDILAQYTSVRYQTQLENGVAANTSLHNMGVVNSGVTFYGSLKSVGELTERQLSLLAMAFANLHHAGAKRNRGFGRIECRFMLSDGRTSQKILKETMGDTAA